MLISIVTLNYKKKEFTIACIHSLYKQYESDFKNNNMEVIIVDNDSKDGSVELIREEIKMHKFVNMHVIANNENNGFGTGCNIGTKKASGEFIVFLNNDTLVKDKGLIKMVNYCQNHQDISILGGQLRNFDGSLQPSTGKFYTLWYAILLLLGLQRFGVLDKSPNSIQKVDWVKGGLLMIRKDDFEKIGGFDEKIFMYTEDMELCYRAHLAGMNVYFYPDVLVLHKDQGSSNKTFAIVNIYKNLLYFYKKHRSFLEYQLLKFILVVKAKSLVGVGNITNNSYLKETYSKALQGI